MCFLYLPKSKKSSTEDIIPQQGEYSHHGEGGRTENFSYQLAKNSYRKLACLGSYHYKRILARPQNKTMGVEVYGEDLIIQFSNYHSRSFAAP